MTQYLKSNDAAVREVPEIGTFWRDSNGVKFRVVGKYVPQQYPSVLIIQLRTPHPPNHIYHCDLRDFHRLFSQVVPETETEK